MSTSSLKISMIGHKHVLSREGGIEVVVKELSTRMIAKGHRVVCYDRSTGHVSGNTEIDSRTRYKGVKIIPVWTVEKKGLAALTSSFSAAWRAMHSSADVVHFHAEGPAAMCWLPKIKNKRVIVTIHGLDWQRAKWGGIASKYIKHGEKQAVKHADAIIVLSRAVQEYFNKEYNRKTVFIPNGVNRPTVISAQMIKEKWGLKKNNYVLFLGRIVPEKGLSYLVSAWNDIKTDKKLVIVGGSSDTEEFMDELKKMAGSNVLFTGFQQGRILEELYSNAYIYTLPSDVEGMPLSLLEAMSYGNCCVVSDIPECKEVVGDKGVVFKKGDINELKEKLQLLLNDERIVNEYKSKAVEYICSKYNWDEIVNQTIELYRGHNEEKQS